MDLQTKFTGNAYITIQFLLLVLVAVILSLLGASV